MPIHAFLSDATPAQIQMFSFGFFFFVTAVAALFIFTTAHNHRLARIFAWVVLYGSLINLFSFLYHATESIELARVYRIISQFLTVPFILELLHFSLAFYEGYLPRKKSYRLFAWTLGIGTLAAVPFFLIDLTGSSFLVGPLTTSPSIALSPEPGTYLLLYIALFGMAALFSAFLVGNVWMQAKASDARTTAFLMMLCLEIPMFTRLVSYAPWYGLGTIGTTSLWIALISGPAFAFGVTYAILRHRVFDIKIVAAELFLFSLLAWTTIRILTANSLSEAFPDLGLFALAAALGAFLFFPYGGSKKRTRR